MMTPEEIQQAMARVRAQFIRIPDSDAVMVPKADLAAVLALTEEVELNRARMQRVEGYMAEWRTKARNLKAQLDALKSEQ